MTATTIVAGCPVGVVWWLRASGTVTSALLAVALGMAISLALSYLGRVIWETRPGSEDLLFSELMVWGYLHRLRSQRRLANVAQLLAPIGTVQSEAPPRRRGQSVKLLEQLVSGLETNDPYLHGHSRRVARHSWMIARRMGLPGDEVSRIRTAAAIHDVGKINTPQAILHKPGRLTDEEYEVIKRHPGEGADMATVLDDEAIVEIVRHHHERADGSGYPGGLAGNEIPLGARIVAVADTFDAITSARPYRAASAHKNAIDILRKEAGTRLDPDVVRAFCNHYAGRRPLAAWSFVSGLPERFVAWLGGGAAGIASAAKVAAVAALVGTTAATATVVAKPPQRTPRHVTLLAQTVASTAYTADTTGPAPVTGSSAWPGAKRAAPVHGGHRGARGLAPVPNVAAPAPGQPAPPTSAAPLGTQASGAPSEPAGGVVNAPVQSGSGGGGSSGETPPTVTGEESQGKAVNPKKTQKEEAAKKAREEAAAKAKAEKEAANKKAREEAAAKAKAEKEAAVKKAHEEAEREAAAKKAREAAKAEKEAAKKAREEAEATAKAEKEAAAKTKHEESKAKAKAEKEAAAASASTATS